MPCMESDSCLSEKGLMPTIEEPRLFIFFKPRGMETTCTAGSDLKKYLDRGKLHPVGRLDRDTTGLLLLSSDGAITNSILHAPIVKAYLAVVRGEVKVDLIRRVVREGVELPDGHVDISRLEVVQDIPFGVIAYPLSSLPSNGCCAVRISTTCGRNRVVRRTLASLGHPVLLLHRESIGDIALPPDARPGDPPRPLVSGLAIVDQEADVTFLKLVKAQ
ncbi:hypothetical protein FOL47_002362 [Perkinsus chesapeaki]|uniref:Pseudouridine synthase RsuA/RluA-like domain-containing protein n=1 Tax=Perkinsus chesapeaki TaxID=330153 RepID=A0A7J6MDZ0_PERCH|nr:hypothetical protein FOL47_002362 [Perkinsus chesapeaki]